MTLRCWHEDPAQRPSITEVAGFLRKLSVSPASMEADLCDFFEVCKTQCRDGQGEKAQGFADELDEVRHAERHNVNSSHPEPRHLTTHIFPRKNGSNTCGTCKNCVMLLTFFHLRFHSCKNPSNWSLLPLNRGVTRVCSRQPSSGAPLW